MFYKHIKVRPGLLTLKTMIKLNKAFSKATFPFL